MNQNRRANLLSNPKTPNTQKQVKSPPIHSFREDEGCIITGGNNQSLLAKLKGNQSSGGKNGMQKLMGSRPGKVQQSGFKLTQGGRKLNGGFQEGNMGLSGKSVFKQATQVKALNPNKRTAMQAYRARQSNSNTMRSSRFGSGIPGVVKPHTNTKPFMSEFSRKEREGINHAKRLAEQMRKKKERLQEIRRFSNKVNKREKKRVVKEKKVQKVELSSDQDSIDSNSDSSISDLESDPEIKRLNGEIKKSEMRSNFIYRNTSKEEVKVPKALEGLANIPKYGEEMQEITLGTDTDSKLTENGTFRTKSRLSDAQLQSLRMRDEETKMKKYRFSTRKDARGFMEKIINLELFQKPEVDNQKIPNKFSCYTEYRSIWEPMFDYEVYSQMINIRKEGAKSKLNDLAWNACVHYITEDKPFCALWMTVPRNKVKMWQNGKEVQSKNALPEEHYQEKRKCSPQWMSVFNGLRENDLILISTSELSPKEQAFDFSGYTFKQIQAFFNPDKGRVLCYVSKKMKKTDPKIELHASFKDCFKIESLLRRMVDKKLNFVCYYITNLSTIIREYKALKCAEFSPFFNALLDPCKYKEELSKREKKRPMHNPKFNKSQNEALGYVNSMCSGGLSLIQGPPGTGKTHTVVGMINMLVTLNHKCPKYILVCTPSNAACDEIVVRLAKENEKNKKQIYNMIRIGAFDYEPPRLVKKYALDRMVEERLKKAGHFVDQKKINELTDKDDKFVRQIFDKEQEMKKTKEEQKQEIKDSIEEIRLQRSKVLTELNSHRQMKSASIKNGTNIEYELLKGTKIILTTLSMSGIELLDKLELCFSHLIIDEASQCTEISSLIPFAQNVEKVILVGDQNQLPATVFSDNAERTNFNRSLYERFLDNGIPCFTLGIQYRMHEMIREFPNNQFYKGMIQDDESIAKRTVDDCGGTVPRLMFYNLEYTKSTQNTKSKSNELEADFVAKIFMEAITLKGKGDFHLGLEQAKNKIGIITPYKRQARVIREKIAFQLKKAKAAVYKKSTEKSKFRNEDRVDVESVVQISTVDSFQGKEKDIIIISCVRASKNGDSGSIGFLNDFRRMNVALTRAKDFLWVVGHAKTLNCNKNWGDFVRHCLRRDCVKSFPEKPDRIPNVLQDRMVRETEQIAEIRQKMVLQDSQANPEQNGTKKEGKELEDGEVADDVFGDQDLNSQEVFGS